MALSREKKQAVVDEVSNLLSDSKMTVIAKYHGTTVKALQDFRRQARVNGTIVKIAKNRLVKLAISRNEHLKDIDTTIFEGMLLYAFNDQDEVAPAQIIDTFNRTNQTFEFVGAISKAGKLLNRDEVQELATLPNKSQMIAIVLATLSSPLNQTISSLAGTLPGILDGLTTKLSN